VSDQATRNIQQFRRSKRREQVTIPEPYEDVASIYRTVLQLKELVEVLAGQRGNRVDVAVTWQDLLDLQLVRDAEIPKDIGNS
jgi:hypothetical protein